jgi:hypothetical protein
MAAPEARRLAIGVTIAIHDGDVQAVRRVLRSVRKAELADVVEVLAQMADADLRLRAGNPVTAREALMEYAREWALE